MIEVRLPLPPSIWQLYVRAGKGKAISPKYKAWQKEAGWALIEQKPKPVVGDFDLWLYVEWPDNRKRDLDNSIKGVLDLLVSHELVEDDSKCQAMHIYRGLKGKECVVRVCERKPS